MCIRDRFKAIGSLVDEQLSVPTTVPLESVLLESGPVREALRCRADASYLITGGMGALGLVIADWLAGRGARRIILAGRNGLPPRRTWDDENVDSSTRTRIDGVRALEARGVAVEPVALDVADASALRAFLECRDDAGAPQAVSYTHLRAHET